MQSRANYNRGARYLFAILLAAIALSGLALYLSQTRSTATVAGQNNGAGRAIQGGKFEASGVTYVPESDGVLFVDDGKPGEVFWMQLDENGNQVGGVKGIKLGVNIEDTEGITTDGSHFYVVSSQSRARAATQAGLVRFKFDPKSQSVGSVETLSELKKFIVDNVAELKGMQSAKAKDDGINIEGLAWDPLKERLLVGLRSPVIDGHALLVPLKLRDKSGPFSYENFAKGEIRAIRLQVGGLGIRSIEYDNHSKLFRIIAGATETQDNMDPVLWEWDGEESRPALREVARLDRKLKPEGITRASIGDKSFMLIVFDTSRYQKMD